MQKNTEYLSAKTYNKIETDFKVEAVAANLMKYYDENSTIFIKKVGINDRPYRKDLKNLYATSYGLDEETIIMETYRESIYDYLPEGLFHPPSLGHKSNNVESVVREIRKQKEVETNARNFFQPFELEFFYTEISALLKETEFSIADPSGNLIETLTELWPLLNEVEPEEAKTLFYILPFLHEVRGNKKWIEKFLTAFLKVNVEINYTINVVDKQNDQEENTALGVAQLGITLIPSGKHKDGERNWEVSIGPLPYEEIHKYVSGHPFRTLLSNIYDHLMPISVKIEEKFLTVKNETSFILSDSMQSNRLGYSTYL